MGTNPNALLPERLRDVEGVPRAIALPEADRPVRALIIVDVQNDFFPGIGTLPAPDAHEIVPRINAVRRSVTASGLGLCASKDNSMSGEEQRDIARKAEIDYVFLSLDWHPLDHWSFATEHSGCDAFTRTVLPDGRSMDLWPIHCLQHSAGAALHKDLDRSPEDIHVRKGTKKQYDSFSAFGCAEEDTGLRGALRALTVSEVYVVGLCTDYCVGETALDSLKNGFRTTLLRDCCKGVAAESSEKMIKRISEAGGAIASSEDIFPELRGFL